MTDRIEIQDANPNWVEAAKQIQLAAFCGPFGVGKDYVAKAAGFEIIGFADPLYALLDLLQLPPEVSGRDKSVEGIRESLQKIGQWGRGTINDRYPITPERLMFCEMVRNHVGIRDLLRSYGIDPMQFGVDPDIWVNGLLVRVRFLRGSGSARLAVTNVRFENELAALPSVGFQTIGVVCSLDTLDARQSELGSAASRSDISERLGQQIFGQFHRDDGRNAPVDAFVWNDSVPVRQTRTGKAIYVCN